MTIASKLAALTILFWIGLFCNPIMFWIADLSTGLAR